MSEHAALNKRNLIKKHACGLSYVDVGGLWGTKGETVTTAARGGSSRLAMADIQPVGNVWWQALRDRCADRGVEQCEEIQLDICAPDAPQRLGHFDFVHCAGVMYHVADLFRFVGNLVEVSDKYLMLSSVVMPEEISSPSGRVSFGGDSAHLTPLLSPEKKQVIGDYWQEAGFTADGLNKPAEFIVDGKVRFGPWWWLFTGEFMSRLVTLHGLEVLAEGATPNGHGYTVFAQVPVL